MEVGQKKQRHCQPREEDWGDTWDHLAMDLKTKLVVALKVGKRTEEQTRQLVQEAKDRLAPGCLPALFSDTYAAYPQAILGAFGHRYPVP